MSLPEERQDRRGLSGTSAFHGGLVELSSLLFGALSYQEAPNQGVRADARPGIVAIGSIFRCFLKLMKTPDRISC